MKKLYLLLLIIIFFSFLAMPSGKVSAQQRAMPGDLNLPIISNDFSARFMDFITNINTQFSALGDSRLQRNSFGARFQNFVTLTRDFGFFDPNIASTAKSFGNVSLNALHQLQAVLNVQPGDTFDQRTSKPFGDFINSLTQAGQSLPADAHNFFISYSNRAISGFNIDSNSFSPPILNPNNPSNPANQPFWECVNDVTGEGGVDFGTATAHCWDLW